MASSSSAVAATAAASSFGTVGISTTISSRVTSPCTKTPTASGASRSVSEDISPESQSPESVDSNDNQDEDKSFRKGKTGTAGSSTNSFLDKLLIAEGALEDEPSSDWRSRIDFNRSKSYSIFTSLKTDDKRIRIGSTPGLISSINTLLPVSNAAVSCLYNIFI